MVDFLNALDHDWFLWIQGEMRSRHWDPYFVAFREKYTWIPLYIFLLGTVFFNYGKKGWLVVVAVGVLITLTDQTSSNLIKKRIQRERPCNETYFKEAYHSAISCSGGYSMPSSHAANHMGLATFLFLLLSNPLRWLLPFWALLVGYSQVYVGVHFPFDVGMGWLLGVVLGVLVMALFSRAVNGSLPGTERLNFRMRQLSFTNFWRKRIQ